MTPADEARPKRAIRPHRWPARRLARLDAALDRGLTDAQAAARFRTTEDAVRQLRHRRGIEPSGARFLSAADVAARLGHAHSRVVLDWLHAGHLRASRQVQGGTAGMRWLVSEDDLAAFLADPDHWHRWDEDRVADPDLRAWATRLRGGAYLTTKEVAARFFTSAKVVCGWIDRGELAAKRRGGGRSGQWMVPAAALEGWTPPTGRPRARPYRRPIRPEEREAILSDWRTGRLSPEGLAWWWGVRDDDVKALVAEREEEQTGMLVAKIELWPGGDETRKRELGRATIGNDRTGTPETGNYNVRVYRWGGGDRVWRSARVEGFPRLRLGPWDLLLRALAAAVGARNPEAAITAEPERSEVAV